MKQRASLECGWCDDIAVEARDDGLFYEDQASACQSCGMSGHVFVHTDDIEDGNFTATWEVNDTDENVAKWEREHPERAAMTEQGWAKVG